MKDYNGYDKNLGKRIKGYLILAVIIMVIMLVIEFINENL